MCSPAAEPVLRPCTAKFKEKEKGRGSEKGRERAEEPAAATDWLSVCSDHLSILACKSEKEHYALGGPPASRSPPCAPPSFTLLSTINNILFAAGIISGGGVPSLSARPPQLAHCGQTYGSPSEPRVPSGAVNFRITLPAEDAPPPGHTYTEGLLVAT